MPCPLSLSNPNSLQACVLVDAYTFLDREAGRASVPLAVLASRGADRVQRQIGSDRRGVGVGVAMLEMATAGRRTLAQGKQE